MTKTEFTKSIIAESEMDIEFGQAIKDWWFTSYDHHYRLTHRGYNTLSKITPSFQFKITAPPNGNLYLRLGKLNCAYFLRSRSIDHEVFIFSTKIATIIQLYGNIDKYLKTL